MVSDYPHLKGFTEALEKTVDNMIFLHELVDFYGCRSQGQSVEDWLQGAQPEIIERAKELGGLANE